MTATAIGEVETAITRTLHTAPVYIHPSIAFVTDMDRDYQRVTARSAPSPASSEISIPKGTVLLVEHVVHGSHADLMQYLLDDTQFASYLHPRKPSGASSDKTQLLAAKIKHNAFYGPDGSLRLGPSVTRFNHACDPSAIVRYVYEETPYRFTSPSRKETVRKDGFAIVYAVKDIEIGEEICYQYNAYAHDWFGCQCGLSFEEREAIEERNANVEGPPIFESNRAFLEKTIAAYLDMKEGTCGSCGANVNNLCRGCETGSYCDRVCQSKDWPIHRLVCKK